MKKRKLAVLFGGVSSEHEVSLVSAKSVLENIPSEKYEIVMIGITKDGRWLRYTGPISSIPGGAWEKDPSNCPAAISPDRAVHGLIFAEQDGKAQTERIDVVFPVLHGRNGEDGTIQGLFMLAGIPFVGCAAAASAVCMDKAVAKMILHAAGVAQAKWDYFDKHDFYPQKEQIIGRIESDIGYPVFVKPANAGSSVGISKASNRGEFLNAVEIAAAQDQKVVVEQAVEGQEIECAVLGNHEITVSVCGEIVPGNDFYDYEAKYSSDSTSGLYIPARISPEKAQEVRGIAVRAYKLLGCEGMARMDFFIRASDGAVLFNEPNTIPGFTSISMYPKLFGASGLTYSRLLDKLIDLAMER